MDTVHLIPEIDNSRDKVILEWPCRHASGNGSRLCFHHAHLRLLIQLLGLVTVPMTSLPPQHTVASLTVVLPPLNGFQQGSNGTSPRTFRNGHGSGWSHIRIKPFFVLPYVGLTFRLLVMCLHAQHAPVRACISRQ
nr:hypothetical protein [Paenibacillus polymyxa]